MTIFWNLADSTNAQDRHYTVEALRDIARVRPQVIQHELAVRLAADPDDDVASSARRFRGVAGETRVGVVADRSGLIEAAVGVGKEAVNAPGATASAWKPKPSWWIRASSAR